MTSIDANPTQAPPPVRRDGEPATGPVSGVQAPQLSRAERIFLFLHRGLDKWLTPLGIWVMRRTKGAVTNLWKVDALLLTTRGRRSGRQRTVVLQFFPDGDAMIVVAANDGGAAHPGWYFNLKSDPLAQVEVMGRPMAVHAEELPADEAAAWWPRIVRRDPHYERYARATSRRLPIVRLVPTVDANA